MRTLVNELERRFSRITMDNYPLEWDENHITYTLMKEMRDAFSKRRIQYKNFSKIVEWFSYKNKGKAESAFGDISLLVNIQFSTGERLRGVAFLEAKRDSASGNFGSISLAQLEKIHSNSPYSHLLLYLHKRQELPMKFPDEGTWESNIWASPVNTAIKKLEQLRPSDNLSTLRVALPFSMLITSRYFWGLDLDYREDSYKYALGGLGDSVPPSFLAVINVYYEGQVPDDIILNDTWEAI